MKFNIEYLVSTYKSKFGAYQSKKQNNGIVKLFISSIFEDSKNFNDFITQIIFFTLVERICLERAFNKIRIKGGMCNPCCVRGIAIKIMDSI